MLADQTATSPPSLPAIPTDRAWSELQSVALLTAVTASIAIGMDRKTCPHEIGALCGFLPPLPTVYPAVREQLGATVTGDKLVERLQSFYGRAVFLRDLTTWYCKSVQHDVLPLPTDISTLAASWQDAAELALQALDALRPQASIGASARELDAESNVTEMLRAVRNGETPCLDTAGYIRPQFAPERRVTARARTSRQIFVEAAESIQRALVVNASNKGFGLWGLDGVEAGQWIRILWKPKEAVQARVIWVKGRHCGVELAAPMPQYSQDMTDLVASYDA